MKRRGPEPGRVRAAAAQQTGFRLQYATGAQAHVSRLSKVLSATSAPGDVELRTQYDGRLIAYRHQGTWFTPDGNPTTDQPDFWTPGSSAHERTTYPRREGAAGK